MKPSTEASRRRRTALAALVAAFAIAGSAVVALVAAPASAQTTLCTSYWAQAGAFRSIDNASRFVGEVQRLAGPGVPVAVVVVPVAGLPLYRVVAGPLTQAAADAVALSLSAGGIDAAISTRTTECPTTSGPGSPPTVTTAAGSGLEQAFRVQVGAFRSADYALRLANDTQAKLAGQVPPGEISVIMGSLDGAPIYRVQSQARDRAAAEELLALVRQAQPAAEAVLVLA